MNYISTRDISGAAKKTAAEAIKVGIADDGGLFMPEQFACADIKKIIEEKMDYAELAAYILSLYLTDYNPEKIAEMTKAAYSEQNFKRAPAVLASLDKKCHVLELYHGPTAAFKDMALQIMPYLLSEALSVTDEKGSALILVATSGDTGKAALEGFRDKANINIEVFYPKNGVSDVQKLQMDTQEGANVGVCSVEGNFDDCQTTVKNIFADKKIKALAKEKNIFFSSANSINFGRLVPQVVYYFYAYAELVRTGAANIGDEVDFTVPTGNFGNILAGYFAKKMGLPVGKLICASNMNNILTDFFETGVYDKNRDFHTTISPSMDILVSSNLERLLWAMCGSESNAEFMKNLSEKGVYTIPEKIKTQLGKDFFADFCGEDETKETIKNVYSKYNYLIDTHTAVAFRCAEKYMGRNPSSNNMIILSTASAYKFSGQVLLALGGSVADDEFVCMAELEKMTNVAIPERLANLKGKEVRFKTTLKKSDMPEYICNKIISVGATD